MRPSWDGGPAAEFDEDVAAGLVGTDLLVGVTGVAHDGSVGSQAQRHGAIVAVTAHGIDIELCGVHEGTPRRAPPVLAALPRLGWASTNCARPAKPSRIPDVVPSLAVHSGERH